MSHTHQHDVEGSMENGSARLREITRVTIVGAVFDLTLGAFKIIFGFIASSQALVADGIHSLSDLLTDGIVLYAARHAYREADEEHPYGHGRIETVATVALGIILIGVAVGITFDALHRLIDQDTHIVPGYWAIVIAGISVVTKEAIYHYTMRTANKFNSNLLRANAWHSRSDAISSIIVIIGVSGSMMGYWYLDSLAAIGVAIMIVKIGWDLAWQSMQELVDTGLDIERVKKIRNTILNVDGVETLHILRTRKMGSDALVDVHIQVDPNLSVSEGHYISETVRTAVIKNIPEVADVMVHIDPENDEKMDNTLLKLPLRRAITTKLEQAWQHIEASQAIQKISLHYLEGKITVEVYLSLAILDQRDKTVLEQQALLEVEFNLVANKLEEIDSIKLLFQ